jgi:hypothetical protein
LPQPWPIARLSTTRPLYRKHNWIAGCRPASYQCRAACQIRSTPALSMSEWSSAPTAVTASKSAGTRILPSGVTFATSARVRAAGRRLHYSPVNCGGRFANVAEMPSVKSFDGKKAAFQAAT